MNMELEPRQFFELLNSYLRDETNAPKKCCQLFTNLNDGLTRESIDLPDIDIFLPYAFNNSHGLLNFISNSVGKKEFKEAVIKVFEIIYTLINNFSRKVDRYIKAIYDICFKIIPSSMVSSTEKVKALTVLILSFEKIDKTLEAPDCYKTIYDKLIKIASNRKCDTVQDYLMQALGAFAKHFPLLIVEPETLKLIFLSELEAQMGNKNFSNNAICGIFIGLNHFCESFPFNVESNEDVAVLNRLVKCIKKLLIPTSPYKFGNRAALKFLANYTDAFLPLIIDNIQYWHESLLQWLTFGSDDQKVGTLVIQSLYRSLGDYLAKNVSIENKSVVSYFTNHFQAKLTDKYSTNQKRLSLFGLASLSQIYQVQLDVSELNEVFISIMQQFEEQFIFNDSPSNDIWEYLPTYLQAVAKFTHFRRMTNSELFCLQKGAILLIKSYPQIHYSCCNAVIESLISTFFYLQTNEVNNPNVFDDFIGNVIYEGIVWSCSHRHISDSEIFGNTEEMITIKNFLPMWRGLLKILPLRKLDKLGIYLNDRKNILTKIIEKILRTLLLLINKLNVAIVSTSNAETVTDIESRYTVEKVNDFVIFLNTVDFYEEIFEEIDAAILGKSVTQLLHHLITKCNKYPLISGFYKLISFSLKSSKKINYFNSVPETDNCLQTLKMFIGNVLKKCQQYKGDLLIACLQVLVQYPIIIIKEILMLCVPAFKTIFQVGRSCIKLANVGLDTLEMWQKEIPPDEFEPFLIEIIPLLDPYLQSKSLGNLKNSEVPVNRRKTAKALSKRKVIISIAPELIKLQLRIVNFIGEQGSALCEAFAFREDNSDFTICTTQHLKIVLPYEDIKLEIYLDKLLPRIIDISLNSTDRKTKIVACELLQAFVMFFLGTSKQMSQKELHKLNETLKYMSVPLLKLGSDLDQVVEQLFRPLCFQLIHWYTHRSQIHGEHSNTMIETILDSITHPSDTALRDFSAKCIQEFVKWTIKQTSQKQLSQNPESIKSLVKKMRFYSTHPDPFKKMGAALIFNNIYRDLREETSLLNIFWIEFLHIFVKSLAACKYDSGDELAIPLICAALRHIQRGFVEKVDLFNVVNKDRIIPCDMEGGCLKDITLFLLQHTNSNSPYCRELCIEMFAILTPCVRGFQSLEKFVYAFFENGNILRQKYEYFITEYRTLKDLNKNANLTPNNWLEGFLCALDGYEFIAKRKLLPESAILSEVMINAIKYFVNTLASLTIEGAYNLIDTKQWVFTNLEKRLFDQQKSKSVVNLLNLLNGLAPHINQFYTHHLWEFIVNMIFNREILGFDYFIVDTSEEKKIETLLKDFFKRLPDSEKNQVLQTIQVYVTTNFESEFDIRFNVPLKQRNIMKGLNLLNTFALKNWNHKLFCSDLLTKLLCQFSAVESDEVIYLDDLKDTVLTHCQLIFDFVLLDKSEFRTLVTFLYKPYQVKTSHHNDPILLGIYLLTQFQDKLIDKIVYYFEEFLDWSLKEDNLPILVDISSFMLTFIVAKKHLRQGSTVVKNILKMWKQFETYFNENINDLEIALNFIKPMIGVIKSFSLECKNLKHWLICNMKFEDAFWKKQVDTRMQIFTMLVDILDSSDGQDDNIRNALEEFLISTIPPEGKTLFLEKLFTLMPAITIPNVLGLIITLCITKWPDKDTLDMKKMLNIYTTNDSTVQRITLETIVRAFDTVEDVSEKYLLATKSMPLFQYCKSEVLEGYFLDQIGSMLRILKDPPMNILFEKILTFMLFEILFLRFPSKVDEEVTKIAEAAGQTTNKNLIHNILINLLDTVKYEDDQSDKEIIRLYKCHAYNALVSIVSNTNISSTFYQKLFIRQANNQDILWHSIVDISKKYQFELDFETIPKKRKILVNIRDEIRTQKRKQLLMSQSVRYIETQRVYNSSLSEDVTKFDFTNNIIRSQMELDEAQGKTDYPCEIELDATDINNHECMASVCGLFEFMVNSKLLILPDDDEDDYILPTWLQGICNLLSNDETHPNIKIFWVKVIDNTIHIFKNFAKWFLLPLLKFITDLCAGNNFNYFVDDVVAILTSWSANTKPSTEDEKKLASELLIFLIKNLNNDRQDMFKYHLDMIRLFVEAWQDILEIPYDVIYLKINVDPTSKRAVIGVHLLSVFLGNNMFPWVQHTADLSKILFTLFRTSTYKSTYKPSAETVGLLIRHLKKTSNEIGVQKLTKNIYTALDKMKEPEKYALILESVAIHYPQIINERLFSVLLGRIHGLIKPLKIIYLKIILMGLNVARSVGDFKLERWDSYIENDSLEVQLIVLEIIHKSLNVLKDSELFQQTIQTVCNQTTAVSVLCRTKIYEIAIVICESPASYLKEVVEMCERTLVYGLTDMDLEIREKVYTFWRNYHIPSPISKRFLYTMEHLYNKETENYFLGYTSYLLLDGIKHSDAYNDILFSHPLEDCVFENYKLETNWRARSLSVVPLFTETLRSSYQSLKSSEENHLAPNQLRETQKSLEFIPTQSVTTKLFSQYTMSESSIFVKSENEFVDPNTVTLSQKYRIPKRRFLRDKSKIQSYYAQKEVNKLIASIEKRKESVKERENKVTIYRNYRKGDLPDIQITLQAILDPLQVLALHDSEIAKILYTEIFQRIILKMNIGDDFLQQISTALTIIFTNSVLYDKNLFRALFDALMHCKKLFIFPSEHILTASQATGLVALGILILEEYLILSDAEAVDSKRPYNSETSNEVRFWIKLAELYKEINDWGVVRAILVHKTDSPEVVKEAIIAESRNNWRNAQDLYVALLNQDCSVERKDFYYDSYFKCFGHLGEWDKMSKAIESVVSNDSATCWAKLWEDSFNKRKLLPWYISSNLKNILFTNKGSNEFFTNINATLQNSEQLLYLEKNFSEQLAMLWTFKEELDETERYINNYLNQFLNEWQQLNLFYGNMRYNRLLKLRNVVDINKFVKIYKHLNVERTDEIRELITYWKRTTTENLPSIIYNEERVLYRKKCSSLLENKLKSFKDEDLEDVIIDLYKIKYIFDESLMTAGINQSNFHLTKKYLNVYGNANLMKTKLLLSKLASLKSSMLNDDKNKLAVLLKGSETLDEILQAQGFSQLKLDAHVQRFQQFKTISEIMETNENLFLEENDSLSRSVGSSISNAREVGILGARQLKDFLEEYTCYLDTTVMDSTCQEHKQIADAYVQLSYFVKEKTEHFQDFIQFVLNSMKYSSVEGRQLFPCILMNKECTEEEMKLFKEKVEDIPLWMFLAWIPQILINIDTRMVSAIESLILNIANTYPQAIMYAYRLSKESYKLQSAKSKLLVEKLDSILLKDQRVDKFLSALSFIAVPATVLLYYIKKIMKCVQSNQRQKAKAILETIEKDIYNCKPNSNDPNLLQGNMYKSIVKFEKEFKNILHLLDTPKKNEDIFKEVQKLLMEVQKLLAKPSKGSLEDYSPWLANFSSNHLNFEIEIPGQYSGNKKPICQHHIKVYSFRPEVSIMSSLRKPIKIVLVGNDIKEYPFLIKFGEDIRQDQRIQQLFLLMNNIFQTDQTVQQLSIKTYQVIPLTTNLGLIQWVDKTASFFELVSEACIENKIDVEKIKNTYVKWIQKNGSDYGEAYGKSAVTYSRDKVIPKYRSLASSVKWDIFRAQFQKISTNMEMFFSLRNNFIKSYAVMSVCHWILGVGDRHLSNSLVCLNSGNVLGIDFGHAFGTATQILPVPELVPLRLTPQIVGMMEPLGEKGTFREIMIHCMRALRNNSNSLLSTMNVFIEEPSLDWLEHAEHFGDDVQSEEYEWYPSQKINQAKKKLEGANSTAIMVEDLLAGHSKKPSYMNAYIELVRGTAEHDFRARKEDQHLCVEDQVDCLIDHSTDYNLLGRMYCGWTPWI